MAAADEMTAVAPPFSRAVDADHPWPGLRAFTEETRQFFFGRDGEIGEILSRVREHALTVLHGASGVGKSSLLGAGLIPKLRAEGMRPVMLRFVFEAGAPALTEQVRRALALACSEDATERAKLLERWEKAGTLWELLHRVEVRPDFAAGTPVLIFDQFEEVFAFGPKSAPRHAERVALLQQVADVIENRAPTGVAEALQEDATREREFDFGPTPLRVVMVLREDFMTQLEPWKKLIPSLLRNLMALRRLTGPRALEAVVQAGRVEGRELVGEEAGQRIVRLVAGAAPEVPLEKIEVSPPLLSLLCDELNHALQSGGVITAPLVEQLSGEILQRFYERSFAGIPSAVRHYVEERMVTASGHRNPVAQEEVEEELRGAGVPEAGEALATLITRRLLSVEERSGLQRLEITHDVLTDLAVRSRTERLAHARLESAIRAGQEKAEREERELAARRERARKRRPVIVMAVFAGVALAGVVAAWWGNRKAQDFARAAQDSARTAQQQREIAEQQKTIALQADLAVAKARRETELKDAELQKQLDLAARSDRLAALDLLKHQRSREALAYLARACDFAPGSSLAAELAVYQLNDWSEPPPVEISSAVAGAIYSWDGRRMYSNTKEDGGRIVDVQTGKVLATLKPDQYGIAEKAEFSRDGSRLLTYSRGMAQVWDTKSGERLVQILFKSAVVVERAQFSPDGSRILTSGNAGPPRVWDAVTGQEIFSMSGQSEELDWNRNKKAWEVRTPRFSPDGKRILSNGDRGARVWDAKTGTVVVETGRHDVWVNSAEYSPDGNLVITSSSDKTARIWNGWSGKSQITLVGHRDVVTGSQFSPDGTRILTTSFDQTARLWDARTGALLHTLVGLEEKDSTAEFSPDGLRILVLSGGTIHLWETLGGRQLAKLHHYQEQRLGYSYDEPRPRAWFSPDGGRILCGTWQWEVAGMKLITELRAHESAVTGAQFSADGNRILTVSDDQTARVWDAQRGRVLSVLERYENDHTRTQISADGRRVMSLSGEHYQSGKFLLRAWDAPTGKLLMTIGKRGKYGDLQDGVRTARLSPDGNCILTTTEGNTASVWDVESGKLAFVLQGHTLRVNSVDFSPDGSRILTAGYDRTLRLWDARTGKPLSIFHEDTGPLKSGREGLWRAWYTPDGSRIAASEYRGVTRMWHAQESQLLVTIESGGDERDEGPQFSTDGSRMVSISENMVKVWDGRTGALLGTTRQEESPPADLQLSPDGRRFVIVPRIKEYRDPKQPLGDRGFEFWEAEGARRLTTVHPYEQVLGARFSADGSRLVTGSDDKTARVWELAPSAPPPRWFSDFLRWVSQETINGDGELMRLPPAELSALRERLTVSVRGDESRWGAIAQWYLAPAGQRPIRPGAAITRTQVADELITPAANEWEIQRAYELNPAHPLVHLALARFERDPARKEFLQKFDLDRLGKDAPGDLRARADALLDPSLPQSQRDRAMVLLEMLVHGRYTGHGRDYPVRLDEAMALAGGDLQVVLHAAWATAKMEQWDRALELGKKAEAMVLAKKGNEAEFADGTYEKILALIATAKNHGGNYPGSMLEAIAAYLRLLEFNPEWAKAEFIAAMKEEDSNLKASIEEVRKMTVRMYPEWED